MASSTASSSAGMLACLRSADVIFSASRRMRSRTRTACTRTVDELSAQRGRCTARRPPRLIPSRLRSGWCCGSIRPNKYAAAWHARSRSCTAARSPYVSSFARRATRDGPGPSHPRELRSRSVARRLPSLPSRISIEVASAFAGSSRKASARSNSRSRKPAAPAPPEPLSGGSSRARVCVASSPAAHRATTPSSSVPPPAPPAHAGTASESRNPSARLTSSSRREKESGISPAAMVASAAFPSNSSALATASRE
mmetsp:Transcript_27522/g.90057  ORF Transcript_27522/g.90057 Transcript_27522/m.90057 type:complete len:254 (-) Transcript_27522:1434-2195(-)